MKFIHTTQTVVDRIKAAGKLLRPKFDSLGHANDAAAVEAGYESYYHVRWCLDQTEKSDSGDESTQSIVATSLRLLPAFLRLDPAVDMDSTAFRKAAMDAGPRICAMEIRQIQLDGGQEYFKVGRADYRASNAGWLEPTEHHVKNQMDLAYLVWRALLDDKHKKLYEELHLYSLLKMAAGYVRGMQGVEPGSAGHMTSNLLATLLVRIFHARTEEEARVVLQSPLATGLLPREMNIGIHTGQEDYESPSTYWSRAATGVSTTMIGSVAALPFGQLLMLAPDARVPMTPLLIPADAELRSRFMLASKARWEAQQG